MRRHLTMHDRLEAAAKWLLVVVVLLLSCGTVYIYVALIVDLTGPEALPRASAEVAFALTAALVVTVTCLTILRNRERSRPHHDAGEPGRDRRRSG
jgi:hypothetical protein